MARTAELLFAQALSPFVIARKRDSIRWRKLDEETLSTARNLGRPLFVHLGDASSREANEAERSYFTDPAFTELVNEHFVPVLVDRREEPSLGHLYDETKRILGQKGGDSGAFLLTPEVTPFFVFPYSKLTKARHEAGLLGLLGEVARLWKESPELATQAAELAKNLAETERLAPPRGSSGKFLLNLLARKARKSFDGAHGGFGAAPKRPEASLLRTLLLTSLCTRDADALAMATRTLDAMASGPYFDQLRGGFARLSHDSAYSRPAFEKLLSSNAALAEVYLEAYQLTRSSSYLRVARETLDFLLREMQSPDGGFFASVSSAFGDDEGSDALWTRNEIVWELGQPDANYFCHFFQISDDGPFAGRSLPTVHTSARETSRLFGVPEAVLLDSLARGRRVLSEVSRGRGEKNLDDQIVCSWNAVAIRALTLGYRVLGDGRYLAAAERAAAFLWTNAAGDPKNLFRIARGGERVRSFELEDVAFSAEAFFKLFEVAGDRSYLTASCALAEHALEFPESNGRKHRSSQALLPLFARIDDGRDLDLEAPNAVLSRVLLQLAASFTRPDFQEKAASLLLGFSGELRVRPETMPALVAATVSRLQPHLEISVRLPATSESSGDFGAALGQAYLPNASLRRLGEDDGNEAPFLSAPDDGPIAFARLADRPLQSEADPDRLSAFLIELRTRQLEDALSELPGRMTKGFATKEGTERYVERSSLPPSAYRNLGERLVSSLGLGTYRTGLDAPAHVATLESALRSGLNLIDTAPMFALGDSERAVGSALARLFDEEALSRDEIVLLTKVGVFIGEDADFFEETAEGLHFTVPLRKGTPLKNGAYSLAPLALERQLKTSTTRLGVETVDVCLIQSPEHLLLAGVPESELREALGEAFSFLERNVEAGRLRNYGVMSNSSSFHSDVLTPFSLLDLAEERLGKNHHLRVFELPINLKEREALEEVPCLSERLKQRNAYLVGLRPLTVIGNENLLRLIERPDTQAPDAAKLREARYRVASLEAEFETTLAPVLRVAKHLGREAPLRLVGPIGDALERSASVEQFDQAETTLVTPRLRTTLLELERSLASLEPARWPAFRARYIEAVGRYLATIRGVAEERSREALRVLVRELEDSARFSLRLRESANEPLERRALRFLLAEPSLTSAVLGLRKADHLEVALSVLRQAPS